jgi:hypothetical protein
MIFFLCLTATSIPTTYGMFNLNLSDEVAKQLIEQLQKTSLSINEGCHTLHLATLTMRATADSLKDFGINSGKEFGQDLKMILQKPILTTSHVTIAFDDRTYTLLNDIWLFLKTRGPRVGSGIIFLTAGLALLIDGVRRIAANDFNAQKTMEAVIGATFAVGGLYLTLH